MTCAPWESAASAPSNCDPVAVLRRGLLIHPTVTGRAEWFRANPYDRVYVRAEDRELWTRVCRHTTFARLREPLFFYREGLAGNLANYLRTGRTADPARDGPATAGRYRRCSAATALTVLVRSGLKGLGLPAVARPSGTARARVVRARTSTALESRARVGDGRAAVLLAVPQTPLPIPTEDYEP